MVKELVNFGARNSNVSAVAKLIMVILKGAKLVGAGGALAPIDFVVSKSRTYYKFLASRSRSLGKSQRVSSAPTLFRLVWRPWLSNK